MNRKDLDKQLFKKEKFTNAVKEKVVEILKANKKRVGLIEMANQIGTSSATLSRLYNGKSPDLETFFRVCKWIKIEPNKFSK